MSVVAYRYWLERTWSDGATRIGWIMLNPSTADETQDDPTIRRVVRFSRAIGDAGGMAVANLYPMRATTPSDVFGAPPVFRLGTEDADRAILRLVERCAIVVAAWGGGVDRCRERVAEVSALLRSVSGTRLRCLGQTRTGQPRHPLFVPSARRFQDWAP